MTAPGGRRRCVALLGGAVGVLGLATLGGCAGSVFRPLKPDVTVADIRLMDGNLLEQRFLLTLRVTNPNSFEIPVEGLNFTLELNGQHFARGVGNRPVTIPKLGEALVDVTATTGLAGFLRQFRGLGKGGEKIGYRLKGRLVTGSHGDLDFDKTGEVDAFKTLREPGGGRSSPERF